MAGKGKGDDDAPQISPEDRARIARSSRQLAAYANFLRWCSNFPREEVARHGRHSRVMMLSPMQSGRFAFATDEQGTAFLGVQPFEATWVATMPFDKAYVSDRLYLYVGGVNCMDNKLPELAIGIFLDDRSKRAAIESCQSLQPIRMEARHGRVASIGDPFGVRLPVVKGDIIGDLAKQTQAKLKQQDVSRFF